MQRFLKATILIVLFGSTFGLTSAHPGRTASDGCHFCRSNCGKWSVPHGVRHCHRSREKKGIPEKQISGYPRIIDGDSIQIEQAKIRLHGIDAPEVKQQCKTDVGSYSCGQTSKNALYILVGDSQIHCRWTQRDRYNRALATCFIKEINLNAEMVKTGMALAFRRYSKNYVLEEEIAKKAGVGLWAAEFVEPWDWRKGMRLGNSKYE